MANATQPQTFKHLRRPLAIVFGLGVVTSLLMIFVVFRRQSLVANPPDPYLWLAMGRSLVRGEGFAAYGTVLNRRGPLYPGVIAAVFLIAGDRPQLIQLLHALMLGGVCALSYDIGRRLYNSRTGVIAAIICAFHPALLRYVADFHVETLLAFLSTLTIWRSVIFLERPGPKNGIYFGLCAAVSALAKPVVLLHPVVFVGWWLLRGWRGTSRTPGSSPASAAAPARNARLAAAMAIFVTMGAVILPWTYRNYRSSGHVVLITTGSGDAFLRGYIFSKTDYALLRLSPYTFAENESNTSFREICRQAGAEWQRDDIETDKILGRAARAKLIESPAGFVRKFFVQLFTFWYQMTSLPNSLIAGFSAAFLWVLALIGWRRARADGYVSWPLYVPILCLNLSLAVLLALGRYSVPILPALAILAAFGVDTLLVRFRLFSSSETT